MVEETIVSYASGSPGKYNVGYILFMAMLPVLNIKCSRVEVVCISIELSSSLLAVHSFGQWRIICYTRNTFPVEFCEPENCNELRLCQKYDVGSCECGISYGSVVFIWRCFFLCEKT